MTGAVTHKYRIASLLSCCRASAVWNKLPINFVPCNSLPYFKRFLKTPANEKFLFVLSYRECIKDHFRVTHKMPY